MKETQKHQYEEEHKDFLDKLQSETLSYRESYDLRQHDNMSAFSHNQNLNVD